MPISHTPKRHQEEVLIETEDEIEDMEDPDWGPGKECKLTSPLDDIPTLVPLRSHDKRPEYLIYAGMVFTVLTRFHLHAWDRNEWPQKAPKHLVSLACDGILEELNQQVVIINRILVDDVNYGIDSDVLDTVLKTVNGIKIKTIKHLAKLIDEISANDDDDAYIRLEMEPKKLIIIACKEAKQSEERILKENSISYARSENLR